jgi:hypothetical protein
VVLIHGFDLARRKWFGSPDDIKRFMGISRDNVQVCERLGWRRRIHRLVDEADTKSSGPALN